MTQLVSQHPHELTISSGKAHLYSFLLFLPFALVSILAWCSVWGTDIAGRYKAEMPSGIEGVVVVLVVMIAGTAIHELIHGLTWSLFTGKGLGSIRFGFSLKSLVPYCHCQEPLKVREYITGAIMPGVVIGIIPLIVAIAAGNIAWFSFGLFFTFAAGGDMLIISLLVKQPSEASVQDHPEKIGCCIYKSQV